MSFPSIAHFAGSHMSDDDIRLSPSEEAAFFTKPVVVYEKLDGINVMLHIRRHTIDIELKPKWRSARAAQRGAEIFARLHGRALRKHLPLHAILVVEWLHHRLSVPYTHLPSPAIAIAIIDDRDRLMPYPARARLLQRCGIDYNTPVRRGALNHQALLALAGTSQYGDCQAEGVIVESAGKWGKWVHPGFVHKTASDVDDQHTNGYRLAV